MTIWMDVDVALSEVPVNVVPLTDDTDFKTIETGVVYNASGMALWCHFITPAGAYTVTQVTPTTGGTYDWANQAQGMYSIEMPASGGASINNDTEGFGYFTGFATGVLPWRGPTIGFRAAGLNDALVESAWSAIRGLAGTALPNTAYGNAGDIADVTRVNGSAAAAALMALFWAGQETGTAQAGGASTITLRSGANATNNYYSDSALAIISGTGIGQVRKIASYVGSTKVATMSSAWITNPDSTSVYAVIGRIE